MVTSLKLSPELKARIAAAAKAAGKSPHAFMLGAIEQQLSVDERRRRFVESAVVARKHFDETGQYVDPEEAFDFADSLARGEKPKKPRARKWRG